MDLFSQIPSQVFKRAKIDIGELQIPDRDTKVPRRARFHQSDYKGNAQLEEEISVSDSTDLDVENVSVAFEEPEEPSTSSNEVVEIEKSSSPKEKEYSDAIIQTDIRVKTANKETQTEESLLTRPLQDDDKHRLNVQTYFTMYSMPKGRKHGDGGGPPLKIGLTLRGKKRKVFYPDDRENQSDSN